MEQFKIKSDNFCNLPCSNCLLLLIKSEITLKMWGCYWFQVISEKFGVDVFEDR